MKVAIVTTILNEISSIQQLVDSILLQTRQPDEVIIVDGGSTDGTVEKLQKLTENNKLIRLIIEKGCNVARGRNIAIQNSSSDIIAIVDGGSRLDPDWLKQILIPFEEDGSVDVVGGWTEIWAMSKFEEWMKILQKPFSKIDLNTYYPSARALAIKKSCWEKVGGFPEQLSMWAEDTVFIYKLKSQKFKFVINPKAKVYWRPRTNIKELIIQHFEYGIGDGEARIFKLLYLKRIILIAGVICFFIGLFADFYLLIIGFLILILGFLRLVVPLKNNTPHKWKLLPLFGLILIIEFAQSLGYLFGLLKRPRL